MNVIFPEICRRLTKLEAHPDEGDRSMSLYFKITLFRWVNTAIIITIATPFTHTLSSNVATPPEENLMSQLSLIFKAELITVPVISILDVVGTWRKHYTAPRTSESQEELNSCFMGTHWEIAERYTNVTKLLFLCFFYAALFPAGYFICSLALLINYQADKFALLRIWKPAPMIDNEIAELNRNFFYPLSILGLLIVNAYHYARFPYDNVCPNPAKSVSKDYIGTYNITSGIDEEFTVSISSSDTVYDYCNQNIWEEGYFPATSEVQGSELGGKWMTSEQETVVDVIGWSGFGLVSCFVLLKYGILFMQYLYSFYDGTYSPSGEDKKISFSSNEEISGYIPQLRHVSEKMNFPLIACNYEDVDPMLFEWEDRSSPTGYDKWDLWNELPNDVMVEMKRRKKTNGMPLFSIIKHYPPRTDFLGKIEKELLQMSGNVNEKRNN